MSRITKLDRSPEAFRFAGEIVMHIAVCNFHQSIKIVEGVPHGIVSAVPDNAEEIKEFAFILIAGALAHAKLLQLTKPVHDSRLDELAERYVTLTGSSSDPRAAWELSAARVLNAHLPHVKRIAEAIANGESLSNEEILGIVDGG